MYIDQFLLIFILLLTYVFTLLLIKKNELGSKLSCKNCNNCCPDCSLALNRIKRFFSDKIIFHLTFRIFDCKRYSCNECGWEGLRWEKN
mgnify:CR=1 FL=1